MVILRGEKEIRNGLYEMLEAGWRVLCGTGVSFSSTSRWLYNYVVDEQGVRVTDNFSIGTTLAVEQGYEVFKSRGNKT